MLRSLAIVVFIGGVAALGVYVAKRPTLARGSVIAAQVLDANRGTLRAVECEDPIEIGVHGARFSCVAQLRDGTRHRVAFRMDRAGHINVVNTGKTTTKPVIKKTSDPWGD